MLFRRIRPEPTVAADRQPGTRPEDDRQLPPSHRPDIKPASGTYCLFMTDSAARQLGYRLLVGSEQLLGATNNQESDAHIRGQNTNPGRSLVNGPVQVFTAVALGPSA